jgi:SAM-dependent methyltransferase
MGKVDFPAGFFERAQPERPAMAGLDDAATAAVRDLYGDLAIEGRVLDLCGASADHFDVPPDELTVFAGDANAKLPYGDDAFDDVLCSGGVGSMTHPRETFVEVARVLRPGGRFVCTFARGLYAPGAVQGWVSTDDAGRVRIVRAYFSLAPAFGPAESDLRTSLTGTGDRLWAVWAAKRG